MHRLHGKLGSRIDMGAPSIYSGTFSCESQTLRIKRIHMSRTKLIPHPRGQVNLIGINHYLR